jgi:transcriptional regulator with XRE-family HTH domain
MIDFGKNLKKLRLQQDLSQAQLAERLGITKSIISAYENGSRMPSYEVLLTISRIFKVSTDYLLGIENKNTLDLSGLTDAQAKAIRDLVRSMQRL